MSYSNPQMSDLENTLYADEKVIWTGRPEFWPYFFSIPALIWALPLFGIFYLTVLSPLLHTPGTSGRDWWIGLFFIGFGLFGIGKWLLWYPVMLNALTISA